MIVVTALLVALRQQATVEFRTLQGFLPICASCHKIRDDQGSWSGLEQYVETHTHALFSYGMCPTCMQKWYPDLYPEFLARHPDLVLKQETYPPSCASHPGD